MPDHGTPRAAPGVRAGVGLRATSGDCGSRPAASRRRRIRHRRRARTARIVNTSTTPTPTAPRRRDPQRQLEVEPQPVERGRLAILEHEDHRRDRHHDPDRDADVEEARSVSPFDLVDITLERATLRIVGRKALGQRRRSRRPDRRRGRRHGHLRGCRPPPTTPVSAPGNPELPGNGEASAPVTNRRIGPRADCGRGRARRGSAAPDGAYCDFYGVAPGDDALLDVARTLVADPEGEGFQLIARDDAGRAVEFVTVYWSWSTLAAARTAIMNDLFVHPDAQGTGLAEDLVEGAGCDPAAVAPSRWVGRPRRTTLGPSGSTNASAPPAGVDRLLAGHDVERSRRASRS